MKKTFGLLILSFVFMVHLSNAYAQNRLLPVDDQLVDSVVTESCLSQKDIQEVEFCRPSLQEYASTFVKQVNDKNGPISKNLAIKNVTALPLGRGIVGVIKLTDTSGKMQKDISQVFVMRAYVSNSSGKMECSVEIDYRVKPFSKENGKVVQSIKPLINDVFPSCYE